MDSNANAEASGASPEAARAEFLRTHREHAQPAKPNLKQVKARYSFVDKLYEEYNGLETQILQFNACADPCNKIKYKKERAATDEIVATIQELYEVLKEKAETAAPEIAPDRLPKLSLPKFTGSFREWQSFYEIFVAMVHSAPLPAIEKFQRLKGCLQGEPLRLIDHFSLSSDNYPLAFQALKDRYDNPRVAANSYLNSLLHFKTLGNDSHSSLQNYLLHHLDSVKAYKALNIKDHYNYLLFQICYGHLDKKMQRAFDEKYPVNCFPTYENLMHFVQLQLRTLELHAVENEKNERAGKGPIKHTFSVTQSCNERSQNTVVSSCYACTHNHPLVTCPVFLGMSVSQRFELLKKNYLCFNCFRKHQRSQCNSPKRCKKCNKTHHTLLHSSGADEGKNLPEGAHVKSKVPSESTDKRVTETTLTCAVAQSILKLPATSILLGTAQGFIVMSGGNTTLPVRILLDPGSQISCIAEATAHKLNIPIEPTNTQIKGVSDTIISAKGKVCCTIYTTPKRTKGFDFNLVVLPTISANLPRVQVHNSIKEKFSKYKLADPFFDQAGRVDVLLGADYYYDIIANQRVIKGRPNGVPTEFGMVLIGEVPSTPEDRAPQAFLVTLSSLEQSLTKFWETEELPNATPPEDEWCETFFQNTVERTPTGRYVVALPFTCEHPIELLGCNRRNALQRLEAMERRFNKDANLKTEYTAFLTEYSALGHMTLSENPSQYVIPHHAVRKDSTTTKLRVVFDASNTSSKGVSLNQLLRKGPKLQSDIVIVISGFRTFKVALVADIKMMYRQILVRKQDRPFQKIFWRESPETPPREFELNTVTYGLASSSYLAQRVIRQLVTDDGKYFPLASNALVNQSYVDDIVAGGDTIEEALQLYKELIELLGLGGFFPRKWSSSSSEVLHHIPSEHREAPLTIHEEDEIMFKVLGLRWDPNLDAFTYQIRNFEGTPTKRALLSYIARMFDPLGWLTPFIFRCKHLMQLLWLEGVGWDEPLPPHLQQQWSKTIEDIYCLSQIRIPRHIPIATTNELHVLGFCDASEKGFACALYLRCTVSGTITVHLLGGKSKVAPVKPLSIPRLELNAALLLAKLYDAFKPFLARLPPYSVSLFSDSTVVLGWLRTAPHKLKSYVCNRVVEILNRTSPQSWAYVQSKENVADCASRGLGPRELLDCSLWWKGPEFLYKKAWESSVPSWKLDDLPELRLSAQVLVATVEMNVEGMVKTLEKYSSFTKLTRVLAYILRFPELALRRSRHHGPLKLEELKTAAQKLVWINQAHYFQKERAQIASASSTSTLKALSPFLDQNDLLRVGGRLGNAPLPYDARHPLLIPYQSKLARLLVEYYHKITLHGEPQITRSTLQNRYWIPKIGNLVKSVIFLCTKCRRHNSKPVTPIMADLPPSRFDQVRPFLRVGTDFAGPFILKETPRRKAPLFKAYICLFVCFSTKAVHVEVVTSLSTESFLAALDRFVARRGICAFIHSDNGTNFVGASRTLAEVAEFLKQNSNDLKEQGSVRQIQWVFNPPAAPHFGGLWEAAVKSFKFHLNRVLSAHTFTLEEFTTLACRIEAILNSRPIGPLPSSPADLEIYLTPGHFLIGAPLLSVPELPLVDLRINTLNRWQLISQCVQNFWRRWSSAYLQTLLPRKKWQHERDRIQIGDVVFITNEHTNPLAWPLARVEEVIKGSDGVTRVVKVRVRDRILTRPVRILHKVFDESE